MSVAGASMTGTKIDGFAHSDPGDYRQWRQ